MKPLHKWTVLQILLIPVIVVLFVSAFACELWNFVCHHESGIAKSTSDAKQIIEYREGTRVTCHKWDDNRWNECSGGIHFYLTKEEAEAH